MGVNTESKGRLNVILASPVDGDAVARLADLHDVVSAFDDFGGHLPDLLEDREVLVVRSGVEIDAQLMDLAPKLALIVRAGSGFDNIDLDHAQRRGIRVVRIPGPAAEAVAEFTLGLILATSRRIVLADGLVRQGRWPKPSLGGPLLAGKVLGVVGVGNIGTRVAELAVALGMNVIGCVEPGLAWEPPPHVRAGTLDEVLRGSDIVTIHTPLTDATRKLIGASQLAVMASGAYLINTSRGGVVDEEALYDALASGRLAGAALDVHEYEGTGVIPRLADLSNVVLTPHIGGMALESQKEIGKRLVDLVAAFVAGDLDTEARATELLA